MVSNNPNSSCHGRRARGMASDWRRQNIKMPKAKTTRPERKITALMTPRSISKPTRAAICPKENDRPIQARMRSERGRLERSGRILLILQVTQEKSKDVMHRTEPSDIFDRRG